MACPAGFYCPLAGVSSPIICSDGTYSAAAGLSAACPACDAGYFCPNTTVRLPCNAGDYCPAGSNASAPCPAGSYCSSPWQILVCGAGSACPQGSTSPQPCTAGSYSPQGAPCPLFTHWHHTRMDFDGHYGMLTSGCACDTCWWQGAGRWSFLTSFHLTEWA